MSSLANLFFWFLPYFSHVTLAPHPQARGVELREPLEDGRPDLFASELCELPCLQGGAELLAATLPGVKLRTVMDDLPLC